MGGKGHHLQPTKEKHDKENLRVNIIIPVRYGSRYDTASYCSASPPEHAKEAWVPELREGWVQEPREGWVTELREGWVPETREGWVAEPREGWVAVPRDGWVPEPSTPLPRAHHLQPQAAPSAAQPDATSSRYFTRRQETGEVQPLSTTFSSASSSQGDVFGEASGSQGGTHTWQQLREMPCMAGHCLRARGASPLSRVPRPRREMSHGCSAGIQGTGVIEALA